MFADSEYPIAAKHFAFIFETTDVHNLLNFEYLLSDDQGNLFSKKNEDKIPALKMLKVKKQSMRLQIEQIKLINYKMNLKNHLKNYILIVKRKPKPVMNTLL